MSNKNNDTYNESQLETLISFSENSLSPLVVNTAGQIKNVLPRNGKVFEHDELLAWCRSNDSVSMTPLPNGFCLVVSTKSDTPRALNRLATAFIKIVKNETVMKKENAVLGDCIITQPKYINYK